MTINTTTKQTSTRVRTDLPADVYTIARAHFIRLSEELRNASGDEIKAKREQLDLIASILFVTE